MQLGLARGEFNNSSARRALVDWYLSIFIMCKAWHQYNERPRALALLNSPQVYSLSAYMALNSPFEPAHEIVVLIVLSMLSAEGSGEPAQICRHDRAFAVRMNGMHIASTRFW